VKISSKSGEVIFLETGFSLSTGTLNHIPAVAFISRSLREAEFG
jgi:hypothetical protein